MQNGRARRMRAEKVNEEIDTVGNYGATSETKKEERAFNNQSGECRE